MPRFLAGDELGNIKSIRCSQDPQSSDDWKFNEHILYASTTQTQVDSGKVVVEEIKASAVQGLAISDISGNIWLAAARSNGALSAFSVNAEDSKLEFLSEWKDLRFKSSHKFIGLDLAPKGLFWCTSNGALGFAPATFDVQSSSSFSSFYQKASLPMRLRAWRLSPDGASFAYGGDEVDLSVWDAECALQSGNNRSADQSGKDSKSAESKKRKRGNDLLPGEVWRARNLPNDSLGLRQPIHVTSLSYLAAGSNVHLATGTLNGDVRRYDTRAACKPVANWEGIGKTGGVSIVQTGLSEHELFVADNGTNLCALDLRIGRTIYSYKKLQGAVTSLAASPGGFLGSTSHDRFFRLYSTFPPAETAGRQQEERGEVLGTVYMKSVPTAVVFDQAGGKPESTSKGVRDEREGERDDMDEDGEDVWATMQDVEDR